MRRHYNDLYFHKLEKLTLLLPQSITKLTNHRF